jgi:hypothetical protein
MNPAFLRCITPSLLTACVIPFGGLQRVKLLCVVVRLDFFDMSSQIAGARNPLQFGLAIGIAIETCGILYHAGTTLTFLNDRMTLSSIVGAPIFSHEDALRPCLYRLTDHGYHLPPN